MEVLLSVARMTTCVELASRGVVSIFVQINMLAILATSDEEACHYRRAVAFKLGSALMRLLVELGEDHGDSRTVVHTLFGYHTYSAVNGGGGKLANPRTGILSTIGGHLRKQNHTCLIS